MKRLILLLWLIAFKALAGEIGEPGLTALAGEVTQCPAAPGETRPPDFTGPDCRDMPYGRADPQGREIWLRARIMAPPALLASNRPAGIFIGAKASSEVYLNGRRLGSNGEPGATRAAETPGRMDAVFFAPPGDLTAGDNEIIIRMSSHRGVLKLFMPVHWVGIGPYDDPSSFVTGAGWPSLIPFGALIAGAIYFAAASASGGWRFNVFLLSLASLFAAGQLFSEASRGLIGYAYPLHDWRLIAITACSLGFGLCLYAHICAEFMRMRWRRVFAAGAVFTIAAVALTTGFDGKAAVAVLAPTVLSVAATGYAAVKGAPYARLYCAALSLFAASIVLFSGRFLDVVFFYEVAALLLVFFAAQAAALSRERTRRESETARARQLELALDRARAGDEAPRLKVAGAGRIDLIDTGEIVFCKGAGDYVELTMRDGREILHRGNLAALEGELPPAFLRVHRSYIVNTAFVQSLTREASGVGRLMLTTGAEAPVSRRIMPSVRSALA